MPKALILTFALLAAVVCAFPATSAAGTLVPPGNSAANQYTETFPTSQGEEESTLEKKKGVTPGDVLGAGKAHQLEDQGAAGKAVAQFTAETAPPTTGSTIGADEGGGGGKKKRPGDEGGGASEGGDGGSQGSGGGGGADGAGDSGSGATAAAGSSGSSGSSALGEIVSQTTGGSSGGIGLLLPLILIAVVVWSGFYVWRHRQQRIV